MANYGIKRPLNQLEGPVYPDIRKAPDRWQDAGKYWKVDVGSIIRNNELYADQNMAAGGVLVQSRDYNKQIFGGASSYQEKIVNFRPPLINYYDDICPQHMVPATTRVIPTRINPTTVVDGGTSAYLADNIHNVETGKYILENKVNCASGGQAGQFFRIDNAIDNSILPDLETKLPEYSLSSGYYSNYKDSIQNLINAESVEIDYEQLRAPGMSGYQTDYRTMQETGLENFALPERNPSVFADAGTNYVFKDFNFDSTLPDLQIKLPEVGMDAGYNPSFYQSSNIEETPINLEEKMPQVSATAGYNPTNFYQASNIEETPINLEEKMPRVYVGSGYDSRGTFHHTSVDDGITMINRQVSNTTKASTPLNARAEYRYREINNEINPQNYIHYNHIHTPGVSGVRPQFIDTENSLRRQMTFRERLQPLRPIGLEQATAKRPYSGIGLPENYGFGGLKTKFNPTPVGYNF